MAQALSGLVSQIRIQLDDAYNLDPNQDFEVLKASLIDTLLTTPYLGSVVDTLVIASIQPDISFSDGGISAAADAATTMNAALSAAFDDELNTLQNP